MIKFNELKKRREGAIRCPSDTRNPDRWDWANWENWPEKDKLAYPLKESTNKRENIMKECNELFIDKWHDTCEVLPDCCEDVWFIADGQYCVGVYEPEQKVFCMADSMGVELKNVRQWKYVGVDKQIAKYPVEKQIIAAFIPGIPCLITGIFSDHCINETNGDEFSGLIVNEDYNFVDPGFADVIPWTKVNYWYSLPEEPITILEPIGDSLLTVMPAAEVVIDDCTGACEKPCEDCCKDPEDTSVDQPVELGQDSMDSPEVKSAIIKASKRPFTEKYNYGDLQNLNRFFRTAIKELNKAIDYLKDNPSCKDEDPEVVIDALGKAVTAVIKAKQKIGPLKESAKSLNVYKREDLQFVYTKISNALDTMQDEGLMYSPYYEDLLSAQNVLGEFIKYNNLDESKMRESLATMSGDTYLKFRALQSKVDSDILLEEIMNELKTDEAEAVINELIIRYNIDFDEWKKSNFYESKKRIKEDYGWEVEYGHEWDLYEEMLEAFGAEELCESLARAMGTSELGENLAYIARMNDFHSEYLGNAEEELDESKKIKEKNWKHKISKGLSNKFHSLVNEVTPDYDDCRQVILDILKQARDFVGEKDWYYDSTIDDLEYADLEEEDDVNWYISEMYDILDSYDIWLSPFEEAKGLKNIRLKETRLYYDLSDGSYKPWSGAVNTWNKIEDADMIGALDAYLEDLYPEGLSETELNDILWFEGDDILRYLGLPTDDDEEEAEEDDEEEDRDGYVIASGDDGKLHKYDLDGNLLESFKDYHLDAIPENLAQKALAYLTHIKEN